ncbi:hypothetical protein ABKN59_007467 [Abortiporus biennis]
MDSQSLKSSPSIASIPKRTSARLVPDRRRPARYEHLILRPWIVFPLAALIILLGVGIEVALFFSERDQGFPVPPPSRIFRFASTSFLTAFFPTLLISPIAFAWQQTDWALRYFQPYIVLAEGNAKAKKSLLLDYIAMGKFIGLVASIRMRHWLLHVSILIALASNFFQPLAGAVLSVKQLPTTQDILVRSTGNIGLVSDFNSLNAFLAAAGFTEAAAFQGLPDPPFVKGNWATAQVQLPTNPGLNASLALNTTGIRTQANCATPTSLTLSTLDNQNYTITASTSDGCFKSFVSFNPNSADQQYGSSPGVPVSCGIDPTTPEQFLPVLFWFFHTEDDGAGKAQPKAAGVICKPQIDLFNIVAKIDLTNGNLTDVQIVNNYTTPTNVSGDPLNGRAFNGVLLDQLAGNNAFVQARATAIRSGIPGAIFRFASTSLAGTTLNQLFDSPDGFLSLTDRIYTQHLSVSAKSVYFVPSMDIVTAQKTALIERLVMDPLAGHALSVLLVCIGLIGFAIHIIHLLKRRGSRLHLTSQPGSIASSVALTAGSGLSDILKPWDDPDSMKKKLNGMRFGLDEVSGGIIVEENGVIMNTETEISATLPLLTKEV